MYNHAVRRYDGALARLPRQEAVPDFAEEVTGRIDDQERLALVRTALEVRNLGRVNGGQGLLLTYSDGVIRLVLDPATSRVRSSSFGDADKKITGTTKVDAAEWTNVAPR